MRSISLSTAVAAACMLSGVVGKVIPRAQGSLPPITTKGNAFYAGNERFYIRGVAYQPGGEADAADPLLNTEDLARDIKNFKELGINTIRIYTIDNSQNHDEAMKMLDEAGIYLALDANTPKFSLNRKDLASLHASYNDVYLQSVFATVDAFAGYNNLLLFFAGNEVINAKNNTMSAPYIKAVTRDMKRYIAAQVDRPIPVGYSAADVAQNIQPQALYFACGQDEWARADFFAFNDYSWCDPSNFVQSGWDQKVKTYSSYSIPLFLSEFGCITNTREWNEISALYSTNMTGVYSGGLAYEYTTESNGYGLVKESGGNVVPNADFDRLKAKYKATAMPRGEGGARQSTTPPSCPPTSENWEVDTENLPEIPEGAKKYIENGAGKGPGLSDKTGSQWAGTPSNTKPDLSDGTTTSDDVTRTGGDSSSSSGSSNGTSAEGAAMTTFGGISTVSAAASAVVMALLAIL